MADEPLQEDAQDEEVEHIEANVQQVGMQEDGCYEAPILSRQYQAVDFRSIFREMLTALASTFAMMLRTLCAPEANATWVAVKHQMALVLIIMIQVTQEMRASPRRLL